MSHRAAIRLPLAAALIVCALLATTVRAQVSLPLRSRQTQATLATHALRRMQPETAPSVPGFSDPTVSDFPALPPDPYEADKPPLPPLSEELWNRGGSYLYVPEGDRLNWPHESDDSRVSLLRLPESWQQPKPYTAFSEYLGADPVYPRGKWFGPAGYAWDVRFVGHGAYSLFGFALEQNNRRQDVIGNQLSIDLDLQLTGTERFHVQFRPLGDGNSGGSFYQFSNPVGYEDNSTAEPQRFWFEGELHSIFGSYLNPFAVMDYNVVAGKFPLALHNSLLMNDEILGVVLSKNTIYLGNLSNLNVQAIYGHNDVNAFGPQQGQLYGMHAQADYRKIFFEATYAFVQHDFDSTRDSHFTAFSATKFFGPISVAARRLFKWGDEGGRGDGQLCVLESNYTRVFGQNMLHVDKGVFFCNAFYHTAGWNPISGGNLNRVRTAFETNPLVRIAAGALPAENWGVALGVQLFRHHQDESLIPEIAFESPDGEPSAGLGLRYLRKTGSRSYFEALGTFTLSNDPRFDREGVFTSYTIIF